MDQGRYTTSWNYAYGNSCAQVTHFVGNAAEDECSQCSKEIQWYVSDILKVPTSMQINSGIEYGWTMTHGFFAVMGGFMLFEHNKDPEPRTLDPFKLKEYLQRGEIFITEKEIQDRSNGDILSKGLVVVQTTWFILQCIARASEHLPITRV